MTVRVGFLGAGLIATYHSKSLRRSGEDVAWAGVHDPDRRRAEAFAAASGATVCDGEEQVLDGCDAVYVCTWTSEHVRLVRAAAERGLAVFCEKPLATDLAGAVEVARAVGAAGVTNQVGLVLRHSPAFNLLRSLVGDPASGRVMAVVFRDDQYLPVQGHYGSTWRGDAARAGAGTLLEHSIHDLDVLEWLCGPVARVAAETAAYHGIPGIEDVAVATLRFASGATASLASVWHDVLDRPSLRRVEVLCERAWYALEGDWWGPVRWTRQGEGSGSVEGEALVAALAGRGVATGNPDGAFVRAVAEGGPAFPDAAVALRAHVVADAAYRSAAAGGRAVDVAAGVPA
ncbi:MAG TPA: Gfo/Idh/MocA family oxidoreductase [Acidimicrobiales bacterium]|jgi:predicted dehydrogenase